MLPSLQEGHLWSLQLHSTYTWERATISTGCTFVEVSSIGRTLVGGWVLHLHRTYTCRDLHRKDIYVADCSYPKGKSHTYPLNSYQNCRDRLRREGIQQKGSPTCKSGGKLLFLLGYRESLSHIYPQQWSRFQASAKCTAQTRVGA